MRDLLAHIDAAKMYRDEADECLRRAEAAKIEGVREAYLSLALSYLRIAEDMEGQAQSRLLKIAREMLTVTRH